MLAEGTPTMTVTSALTMYDASAAATSRVAEVNAWLTTHAAIANASAARCAGMGERGPPLHLRRRQRLSVWLPTHRLAAVPLRARPLA